MDRRITVKYDEIRKREKERVVRRKRCSNTAAVTVPNPGTRLALLPPQCAQRRLWKFGTNILHVLEHLGTLGAATEAAETPSRAHTVGVCRLGG